MAISFLAGQRLTADLLNTNVIGYMPQTLRKASATARTSTTTFADDPDLDGIQLTPGVWEVELLLFWTQSTTNTQKIKTRWFFTGSWSTGAIRGVHGGAESATSAPTAMSDMNTAAYQVEGQSAIYSQNTGGVYGFVREVSREVTVTSTGNMSLQWAQNSSSANATTVQAGSVFNWRLISV